MNLTIKFLKSKTNYSLYYSFVWKGPLKFMIRQPIVCLIHIFVLILWQSRSIFLLSKNLKDLKFFVFPTIH
jgi:hypothetical protein